MMRANDRYNNNCFHSAAEHGNIQILDILLKSGRHNELISNVNDDERTPLHIAAKFGRIEVGRRFVEQVPGLLEDEDFHRERALHLAASNGHADFLEMLLHMGAAVDSRYACFLNVFPI